MSSDYTSDNAACVRVRVRVRVLVRTRTRMRMRVRVRSCTSAHLHARTPSRAMVLGSITGNVSFKTKPATRVTFTGVEPCLHGGLGCVRGACLPPLASGHEPARTLA